MFEILGMNSDKMFSIIILLILIILGIVTFHFYSYVSVGKDSVLSGGSGASFRFMPLNQKEQQLQQ